MMGSEKMGPVWAWRSLLAALLVVSSMQKAHAFNAFLDQATAVDADGNPIELLNDSEDMPRVGSTPAKVVIDKVVAFPIAGGKDTIVLRNIGGQPADIRGWKIVDQSSEMDFVMQPSEDCPQYNTIPAAGKLEITGKSDKNPCGFPFNLSFKDSIKVKTAEGDTVQGISWENFDESTALKRTPSGSYIRVPEDSTVLDLLSSMGEYTIFLKALEMLKLDTLLQVPSDPNYEGPMLPAPPPAPPVIPQFPSHFGFARDRSMIVPPPPPPPPPPPAVGIPKQGPFTIIAPTDEAFETIKQQLAGPGEDPLSTEELLDLPEMDAIMKYHIVGGEFPTDVFQNNTPIFTTLGVEFVPFTDPIITEGAVVLHDSCVDKPTVDVYSCEMQKMFGKCHEIFMISPLAANWRGGTCERTCERCTCDFGQCATTELLDLKASNGIVHTISRLMFPPPNFMKEVIDPVENLPTSPPKEKRKVVPKPKVTIGFKPKENAEDSSILTTG